MDTILLALIVVNFVTALMVTVISGRNGGKQAHEIATYLKRLEMRVAKSQQRASRHSPDIWGDIKELRPDVEGSGDDGGEVD